MSAAAGAAHVMSGQTAAVAADFAEPFGPLAVRVKVYLAAPPPVSPGSVTGTVTAAGSVPAAQVKVFGRPASAGVTDTEHFAARTRSR